MYIKNEVSVIGTDTEKDKTEYSKEELHVFTLHSDTY